MAVEIAFSGKETVSLASNRFGEGPSRSIVYRLIRNGANGVKMQGGLLRFFGPARSGSLITSQRGFLCPGFIGDKGAKCNYRQ